MSTFDPTPQEPIRIVRARSRRAVEAFIAFPYRLHRDLPRWVPPLRRDVRTLLDRDKHPFHQHAVVEYFLALRGRRVVGRVAAIENHAHNVFHEERVGFFGFLEAENDAEVFAALLRAAEVWCRRRGLVEMRGPCSFSTNEECGLLVENFHSEPMVMMSYHPPYYADRVAECGYAKAEDLLCYWVSKESFAGKVARIADASAKRLERSGHVAKTRPLDKRRWNEEVALVKQLYNAAWEKNWGFVPLTDAEIDFLAHELKPIVVPEIVLFLEVDGEPAGFCLSLPDYNLLLKHMRGWLSPRSILTALLLRPHIHTMRMLMLGVLPAWRGKGLDFLLIRDTAPPCLERGITEGEMSWILERNTAMCKAIVAAGGEMYRRYRIYSKPLAD